MSVNFSATKNQMTLDDRVEQQVEYLNGLLRAAHLLTVGMLCEYTSLSGRPLAPAHRTLVPYTVRVVIVTPDDVRTYASGEAALDALDAMILMARLAQHRVTH